MKKIISILIILVTFIAIIIGSTILINKTKNKSDKIQVIATLFPQYDFAKIVGGDKVDVSLLLPSGVETHKFEPTPQDIININNSELLIYTGEYMEPWVKTIIESIDSTTTILDASKNIQLMKMTGHNEDHIAHNHEEEYNCSEDCSIHNHEYECNEECNTHDHEDEHDCTQECNTHNHKYDPHIWLDPIKAIGMVENIRDSLCEIDPDNSEYYKNNAEKYINELNDLDNNIEFVVNRIENPLIAFGGTFAYSYFIERYKIDFISAYSSCGEESEPSVIQVKNVIDGIKKHNLPVVFYQELSQGNIAKMISENTGAVPLIFHSIHNVSVNEINDGASYLSLMRQNFNNLKIALGVYE